MPAGREVDELLRPDGWESLAGHFGDGLRVHALLESLRAAGPQDSLAVFSTELVQEIAASYGPSEILLPAVEVLVALTGELSPCSGSAASVIVDVSAELLEFADGESEAAATVRGLDVLTLEGFPAFVRLLSVLEEPVSIDACIRLIGSCAELDSALNRSARQVIRPFVLLDSHQIRRLAGSWVEILDRQV